MNTKFHTIHINDTGAIEDIDEKIVNGEKTFFCKIYNDSNHNQVNDILHTVNNFIVNKRVLDLLTNCKLAKHSIASAIVKRTIFFPFSKKYKYYKLEFSRADSIHSYEWIDFNKSEIHIYKGTEERFTIAQSHKQILGLKEENKRISKEINQIYSLNIKEKQKEELTKPLQTYTWITKKIVFSKNFDSKIDMFQIPLYSWGTYVSDKLKTLLERNQITDIHFSNNNDDLSAMWKKHYPIIKFEND